MNRRFSQWLALLVVPLMAACGGGGSGGSSAPANSSTTPGTLVYNPPLRVVSLSAAAFQANLSGTAAGRQLLGLATLANANTPPPCGVDVYKLQFNTLGGGRPAEHTQSSGVLMVPTGGTGCSGSRPIVLYAHGTTTDKSYDLAQLADPNNPANGESALIAAMYAANGFIVVAPNYAGYDNSTLSYHPYLNAQQQSGEMIDALRAAQAALPKLPLGISDSGELNVSGYSQGGHVAMATVRALQILNVAVHASAPMS